MIVSQNALERGICMPLEVYVKRMDSQAIKNHIKANIKLAQKASAAIDVDLKEILREMEII